MSVLKGFLSEGGMMAAGGSITGLDKGDYSCVLLILL